ncbi:MAG: ABC transporter substrate-binding protein [Proteobacteria bacterium]|nr:ABC transporter substrate-binding protein [Pseudomonadota bacterium]
MASSYKYADEKTIDVTLRRDIHFHDGSRMTADDVVYTYRYVIEDKANKPHKTTVRWLQSVEKTGDYSLRFRLKTPYPLALRDMARRIRIRKNGIYGTTGNYNKKAQAVSLIGLGPYKVVSFEPGRVLILERFDGYYDGPKGRPAIKRVKIRSIPDLGTQQAELMTGNIDWIYNVPMDVARNMGRTGRARHVEGPSMRVGFIPLDAGGHTGTDNPLTKLKVRRAVIHAINRENIIRNLVGGTSKVIHTACHPIQFGCTDNVRKYEYDPKKAKQLIAEAGYPDGFRMDLWAYREKQVSEAIASDLTKAGIKVNLRYSKLSALNKARRAREIPAYFGTWASGGTADVAAIANVHWSIDSDRNLSGDPKVTELMLGAEKTSDSQVREELYRKGLQLIADRAYWVPLYAFTANYLTSNDLNFPVPEDGLPRLYSCSWK